MKAEGLEYWSQKIKKVAPYEEHRYLFSKAGVKVENGGISPGAQKESFSRSHW
ncbi:hypothetical protein KFK09_020717 [Dendrobium nobile]|uniref:Uncharacterized protein n=1 Tax=Dendrobium nobile TaxID=94219 RepID=A0A8T3AML4_DENNO|nr:hypothetical protein KFK09_020716 [Dendrobium nobile]KAI0497488.1 hypothetical protein KFK09_020717 [Dendrobium nobile]